MHGLWHTLQPEAARCQCIWAWPHKGYHMSCVISSSWCCARFTTFTMRGVDKVTVEVAAGRSDSLR